MKISMSLILLVIIFTAQSHASVTFGMSIAEVNADMEKCYQQTELVAQQVDYNKVSIRSCNRVIQNHWSPQKIKAIVLHNRGLIHLYKGEVDKAESDFQRSLLINSEQFGAHIVLAQIFVKQQKFADALKHYERAFHLDSTNEKVRRNKKRVEVLLASTLKNSRQSVNAETAIVE